MLQWLSTTDITRQIDQQANDTDRGNQFDKRLQDAIQVKQAYFAAEPMDSFVKALQGFGVTAAELLAAKPDGWSGRLISSHQRAEQQQRLVHGDTDHVALVRFISKRFSSNFDLVVDLKTLRVPFGVSTTDRQLVGESGRLLAVTLDKVCDDQLMSQIMEVMTSLRRMYMGDVFAKCGYEFPKRFDLRAYRQELQAGDEASESIV
ncbi:hypothetical protein BC828DRAFT_401530 [Blastocladiella britannica]|nr:hypothetical protein BC828DRAFT_401530 [Blastocladiella britannica]